MLTTQQPAEIVLRVSIGLLDLGSLAVVRLESTRLARVNRRQDCCIAALPLFHIRDITDLCVSDIPCISQQKSTRLWGLYHLVPFLDG